MFLLNITKMVMAKLGWVGSKEISRTQPKSYYFN